MCFGGGGSMPQIPETPKVPDAGQALLDTQRRTKNTLGLPSTILTGAQGLTTPATTAVKSLTGS